MHIGLVGWGVETKSAFRYLGNNHDYLIVSEEPRDDFPNGNNITVQTLQDIRKPGLTGNVSDTSYMSGIEDCDQIIITPSARKNLEKVYPSDHVFWTKATTTLDIFFDVFPRERIIGITGTKGKGTTSTLIAEMLRAAGEHVLLGGNIGVPVLDLLAEKTNDSWAVLELSSFQLYKFNQSPHIAVHLMMIPEHIDEWHKTMDDYTEAKQNICSHQTEDDVVVYHPNNQYSRENAQKSAGQRVPYTEHPGARVENGQIVLGDTEIISTDKVALKGKHNLDNICAAVTAVSNVTDDFSAIAKVIAEFKGLEHRLQFVREVDGVEYYSDSFGTTPDTSAVAMDAFKQQKVMVVGGHDKGNDMTVMLNRLNHDDIRHIIALGITGNKLAEDLIALGFPQDRITYKADDMNNWNMKEIVTLAKNSARSGDVVLLSTGSASFGIFKDYKDRGNQFIEQVNQL